MVLGPRMERCLVDGNCLAERRRGARTDWAAAGGKLATDVGGEAAAALGMDICRYESITTSLVSRDGMGF
jgi:hypothetical protein